MATKLDYDALRAQTMGTGNDEAVTVNTRALIDKVLARYSGDWTTLRELLQNAADASAKRVTIKLETFPSPTVPVSQSQQPAALLKHVLQHHTLKSTIVENDGQVFKVTDWSRLKKIAEGNPDETKIGAFGVGFYSVFSDCEEPFVSSGKEALAFYWKNDALFTRRMQLPNGQTTNTTFMLPLRNHTSPIPNLMSLCRFLTSSLTFVGLEVIELWLDNWRILKLNKKVATSMDISIPKEVNRKTREGLMHVASVTKEAAQVDANWLKAMEWDPKLTSEEFRDAGSGQAMRAPHSTQSLRSFFSRLAPNSSNSAAAEKLARDERELQHRLSEDLLGESSATIFVHVNKAAVRTSANENFSSELERATKKPPPKITSVSLLSASYDESLASASSTSALASEMPKIFDSFTPINGKGRIFIGFTTNQTTGLNVHISTPSIIPTVERESIDLNNRFVRIWNIELLRAAGIIARVSWGHEMEHIQEKLSRAIKLAGRQKAIKQDIAALLPDALFMHNAYSWSETTPSPEVGTLIEEAFWTCNQKTAIATLSTQGVLPSSQVRTEPEEFGFVEGIPALPQALVGVGIVKKLIDYGVITEITVSDIKKELEGKALNAEQLRRFLEWLGHKAHINEIDEIVIRSLLNVAVANDDEGSGRVLVLGEMKTFLNTSRIPAEMPVPPYVLPFKFTKKMSKHDLELLGFEDLQMVPWLRWLVENIGGRGGLTMEQDISQSSTFASVVLPVISKQWEGLSQSSKATTIDLLASRTVIPTKMGMRKPSEAYFPSVKLFDDLPVISSLHSVKDKFLLALGVRKTIEIGVVFERLMDTSPTPTSRMPNSVAKWSHFDLIRYLASVRADIPPADINRLKNTKICPAETESIQATKERYLVSELFEPDQTLRRLRLRTLQWPGSYRRESPEGRFLTYLGLRAAPSYTDLIHIMSTARSNQDLGLREHALRYFIDHHQTKGYAQFDHSTINVAYLPIQDSEQRLATPSTVFVNEAAAILGFDILRRDLQVHALKFGVAQDPPVGDCIGRLISNPPQSHRNAREIFTYLAGRLSDLKGQHVQTLSRALIVPVTSRSTEHETSSQKSKASVHIPPPMCFLGNGDKYADIFDYVDFGPGNQFLLAVGSKHEPSTIELARLLIREPAKIFSLLGDSRYLELLRNVADSWRNLKKDKSLVKEMKNSRCLLAYKEITVGPAKSDIEEDEPSGIKSWELATASQIVVVDDIITYNLFKDMLRAAPMEETLEDFYHSLGAAEVSTLLEERQNIGNIAQDQTSALKLQQLLQERTRLFLHSYPSDSVKHNYSWVEKNLTVECVQSISLKKSLRGYNLRRNEKRSSVINNEKPILYIAASGYDMFEVSQALVPVLLQRSKPESMIIFEMILESSLSKLRSRGYNVDRILRAKATEARIAETTRKQQLAEEQLQIKEREKAWKESQAASAARTREQNQMPGLFPDSPDRKRPDTLRDLPAIEDDQPLQRPRGLFSGIGKQFGFDTVKRALSHPSRGSDRAIEAPQGDAPPPYFEGDREQKSVTNNPQPETVTAPHELQQNLVNAIQASRPHNSNGVMSQPEVNNVKETATYCDAKPGEDISFIGETSDNIRIFLSNAVDRSGMPADKFMAANASALKLFANLLVDCADSFALKRNSIHIYYDESGSTIAFNKSKALFFNYRYFENLHLPLVQQGNNADAIAYWSIVMAHEVAHNLVSDHSSQHSYYTESLVIQYFGKIASKIASQQHSGSNTRMPILPRDPPRSAEPRNKFLTDVN